MGIVMSSNLCVDCGNPIPPLRVEAVPTTVRCIHCEAEYEKTHDIRKSIYRLEAEEQLRNFQANTQKRRLVNSYSKKTREGLVANRNFQSFGKAIKKSNKNVINKTYPNPNPKKKKLYNDVELSKPKDVKIEDRIVVWTSDKDKNTNQVKSVTPVDPSQQRVYQPSAPSLARNQRKNKNANSNNSDKILVKCPHCNSNVRSDKLQNHIYQVHHSLQQIQASKKLKAKTESQLTVNFVTEKNDTKKIQEQPKSNYYGDSNSTEKIDGSCGWHILRDKGQFGSHPMFDPMDDESTP